MMDVRFDDDFIMNMARAGAALPEFFAPITQYVREMLSRPLERADKGVKEIEEQMRCAIDTPVYVVSPYLPSSAFAHSANVELATLPHDRVIIAMFPAYYVVTTRHVFTIRINGLREGVPCLGVVKEERALETHADRFFETMLNFVFAESKLTR